MNAVKVLEQMFNLDSGRILLTGATDLAVDFLAEHGFVTLLGVEGRTVEITQTGRAVMALVLEDRDSREDRGEFGTAEPDASDSGETATVLTLPKSKTYTLAKVNQTRLADLAEIYGVPEGAVLNIAVSDLYDGKMVSYRDAEED